MGSDEEGTLTLVTAYRRELIDPTIRKHKGRIVKTTGDGVLVRFDCALAAARAAIAIQEGILARNVSEPSRRLLLRIGINSGDIMVQRGDIFGNEVNIAQRLESIADPGGICVSGRVMEDIVGKIDGQFEDLGDQQLKNISRRIRVYRVTAGRLAARAKPRSLESFRLRGDVVGYVTRPPGIAKSREVYALRVIGDSMSPRFEHGDLVYVTPSKKPTVGDYVVVQLRDSADGQAGLAMIKRLVQMEPSRLRLAQLKPVREVSLSESQVSAVHKILTLNELVEA